MKKKNDSDLRFSILKVKKLMQENKEIGKIAKMTPYVICNASNLAKSLEFFISELMEKSADSALKGKNTKVFALDLKRSVLDSPHLAFLLDIVNDISDEKTKKRGKKKDTA